MKEQQSNSLKRETQEPRQRLSEIRDSLLALHKALVDSERINYEQTIGPIQSPNQFLQLLTTDPWFAWLNPFSQLIVAMDEVLDGEQTLTRAGADALAKQSRLLLAPSESGDGFGRHYFDALQRDPDVILAHAQMVRLIGPLK